jgi:ATP-dependent 26S proteasome regulatory subunit
MGKAFQNPELENKYNAKIKERKELFAKRKQTNLTEEKVTINKRIEELDSEIEEIRKQGLPTGKNILEASRKQNK